MTGLAELGVDVLVSALTDDEQRRMGLVDIAAAAAAAGVEYISFPIPDRGVPRDFDLGNRLGAPEADIVALGVRLAAHVRAGRFVVTQCFAGIGRSTLLAGATLVMLGAGPQEALRLVSQARGLPVPDTEAQRAWLFEFAATHGA
jgi:protein-tyrosine phosphatase